MAAEKFRVGRGADIGWTSFNRYQPPRLLEIIEADIKAVEHDVLRLLKEMAG